MQLTEEKVYSACGYVRIIVHDVAVRLEQGLRAHIWNGEQQADRDN